MGQFLHELPEIPTGWQSMLSGYARQKIAIGRSGASVYRLNHKTEVALFIKAEPVSPFAELPGEAERLRWLSARGVPCAVVLAETTEDGWHWLLLSAVPGCNLAEVAREPGEIVATTLEALRCLHDLDPALCPFDHRIASRLHAARARLEAGLVDPGDLDDERRSTPLAELMRRLQDEMPEKEDLVVTHGDACLPNLIATDLGFSGFVDCGRLGVADRHQDLALAAWSIRYNLGSPWDEVFLEHYGGEIDRDRLDYFRLLDEFF